jgi:hypothetical protein
MYNIETIRSQFSKSGFKNVKLRLKDMKTVQRLNARGLETSKSR